jgi:mRNA interferase RelE/StbE
MKTEFRKSFEKDLSKIKNSDLLRRIEATIEAVENVDSLTDVPNIKKMKADGDYYRIRIGEYRIGLSIREDIVIFVRALHRKEIYRYFP